MKVEVQRIYRFNTDNPLKAFVDVVLDECLMIKGIQLLDGKNGMFIKMPQMQAKDKKWYETVRCLTQELEDEIKNTILEEYNAK